MNPYEPPHVDSDIDSDVELEWITFQFFFLVILFVVWLVLDICRIIESF